MYCKNCGNRLPDNARFCDKCNMSARKKDGKMDMIEELKEERLARQKAHEIEARLKKIKKVKRKRYKAIALVVLGIFVVWLGIVGWTFWENSRNSSITSDKAEYNPTTPIPTQMSLSGQENDVYTTISMDKVDLIYPKTFNQAEVEEGDCVASFSDGSAIIIFDEYKTSEIARDLMDAYVESVPNADPDQGDSMANDNGYEITFTAGTKMYHKKCIIKDGKAISYEIRFPADSAEKYEKNIKEMDAQLTIS